jgi:hypothetical protein
LKEVDFIRGNIWIEVDGCWHFGMNFTQTRYDPTKIHARDLMLCKEAERRGTITLVRLAPDCWRGNGKAKLKLEWAAALNAILSNPKPGIWFFGESYLHGLWEKDICMTWKYVTNPITFNYPTAS